MATLIERTSIIRLVTGMFNAAPGATYLSELVTFFDASGGTSAQKLATIATALGNTSAYKALNPTFQVASEFASKFLTPLGLQANQEAIDFITAKFNAGVPKGQIAYEAITALNNSTAPAFADARAILTNKTAVGEYFSVTKEIAQTDVAQLQSVVANVTAAASSVTAANTAIDNGAGTTGTGGGSVTFTLTTAADTGTKFTGSTSADTFVGAIGSTLGAADGTTFNPGDNLDGGAGLDTMSISVSGGDVAGGLDIAAVTLTNIERIAVSNYETTGVGSNGANTTTDETRIDLAQATGVTTLALAGSSATGDTYFTSVKNLVNAEMSNGSGDLVVGYTDAAVAGTADAQKLTVSGITGGQFTAIATTGGVESLAITSAGSAANKLDGVTNVASLKTITVDGAQRLTIGTVGAAVTSLNASASTGGLVATLSTTVTATIVGSAGNDSITAGTNLTTGSVNAGDGTDTLVSTADALIVTAADGAKFTNFETLSIANTTPIATANRAQDVSLLSGITTLNVTQARAHDAGAADTNQNVTFTKLAATTNTINATALKNSDTDTADDLTVVVTASRATDTTADATTVNLGTATAASGANQTAVGSATAGSVILDFTLNGEESITINSLGGANTIGTLTSSAMTSLTVTGAQSLAIGALATNTLTTKIDASAMTANFTMGTNAGTTASSITGGTGNDSLVGGTKADVISGGVGNDSIVGGAGVDNLSGGDGNDTFTVATATHFQGQTTAETVDGGAGNDTLSFTADMTLVASDISAVKNVEIFAFASTGANSITVSDAYFTNAGVTALAIRDTQNTAALTVDASTLTAANSVQITANSNTTVNDSLTGGAGNDTFSFSTSGSATALDLNDVVNGNKGTDTLAITLETNALTTAVLSGVSNIEAITVTDKGANFAAGITAANGNFVTITGATTVGVVDASAMTGGGAFTFNGVAETDSAMSITGGVGADNLTGGSKADTISGGDGTDAITGGADVDNLSGGAGIDTFTVATVAHFIGLATNETVSGGTGNDILKFTDAAATTVNSTDLTAISSVETVEFNGTGAASITLTDAVYTANGATSLRVSDTENTAALTVNASGLSAANSIAVAASLGADGGGQRDSLAGGAGNDTFTFDTTAAGDSLAAGDSVNGGAGTDTLAITVATNALTAVTLTNVSNIERITVANAANNLAAEITLVNGNFVSVTGAVVDASAMVGSGVFTFTGSSEAESTLAITGGAGADVIVAGQKADTVNGGSGADVITGGLGADSLTGGNGIDTFVYLSSAVLDSSGTTLDTIADFTTTSDKIRMTLEYSGISAGVDVNANFVTTVNDLSAKRGELVYDSTAGQLSINVNNDNLITTQDIKINVGTVAAGDVNFNVTGTNFGDTIIGGAGADTLTGGTGGDRITGGNGSDTVDLTAASGDIDTAILTGTAITSAEGNMDTITGFYSASTANSADVLLFGSAFTGGVAFGSAAYNILASDSVTSANSASIANKIVDITGSAANYSAESAAVALFGSAFSNAANEKAIFLLDNGTNTYVYYVDDNFDGVATTVTAADVVLIGVLNGVTAANAFTAATFGTAV